MHSTSIRLSGRQTSALGAFVSWDDDIPNMMGKSYSSHVKKTPRSLGTEYLWIFFDTLKYPIIDYMYLYDM
jgi:hypothetical protein